MQKHSALIITLLGLFLSGAGILLAQTETPTPGFVEPTPTVRPMESLDCDLDTLLEQKAAFEAQLAAFDAETESNPGLALDNLFKVGAAYQELALACGYIPADAATRAVGTEIERILVLLAEVHGDPINGQVLYNTEYGCAGCHEGDNRVAPATEGTYTRAEDTRLADPALAGYTAEQYLVESIVLPGNYVVEGYQNVMPHDFGERLTLQELADLIRYLESQDQVEPPTTSVVMPIQTTMTGELTSANPYAQYSIISTGSTVIIIHLTSDDFDPYLSILSSDNTEIANNDDFAGTTNARIGPFLLSADGTYTVQVDSYDRQSTGEFTLELNTYDGCGIAPFAIVNSSTDPINLRSGPGTAFDLIGNVHNRECLQIVGRSDNRLWLKIESSNGRTGWIQATSVEVAGDITTAPILSE